MCYLLFYYLKSMICLKNMPTQLSGFSLKEPLQIGYKKYDLLWNKHEYQHSNNAFVKNIFDPFFGTGSFCSPLNMSGN